MTLYAQWRPQQYQVTFNVNGGSWTTMPSPNPFTVTYGQTYASATAWNWALPTKPGMLFMGWNTKTDGSGMYFGPNSLLGLTYNHTLYAVWVLDEDLPESVAACYEGITQLCAPSNYSGYRWTPTTGLDNPNTRCPNLTAASMASNSQVYTCTYTLGHVYNYNFILPNEGFSSDYDILTDLPGVNNELHPERKICVTDCWANVHPALDLSLIHI